MAAFLYDRLVTDHEYVQRVRQQRPSALLPVIAAASARWHSDTWWDSPYRKYTPWALADVARTSLAYGNEYRGDGNCTENDLMAMLAAYAALTDPMVRDGGSAESVASWLLRISGEQFTYQESGFNDLARTAALFGQTPPARTPTCLVDGWDEELLGCSLSDYVGVTQLLQVAALRNEGRFDLAWLSQPQMEQICSIIPASIIREITDRHFVTDPAAFKAENAKRRSSRDPHLRRFEYTPLRGRPFLSGFGAGYLAPSSHLIIPKGSPLGLYYMGVDHFGNDFARELGDLFEQYVGRQLGQLADAEVYPEIIYRDERRSVDWLVVFDDLVLLVEVKSTRPTQQLRLGILDRTSAALRQIKHAYKQLETTAALITDRNPSFRHIPAEPARPRARRDHGALPHRQRPLPKGDAAGHEHTRDRLQCHRTGAPCNAEGHVGKPVSPRAPGRPSGVDVLPQRCPRRQEPRTQYDLGCGLGQLPVEAAR